MREEQKKNLEVGEYSEDCLAKELRELPRNRLYSASPNYD